MTYFDFEDEDPIWDIIRKHEIPSKDIKNAILAWAYIFAKEKERDGVFDALNKGFMLFRRKMQNINEQELRKIYGVE